MKRLDTRRRWIKKEEEKNTSNPAHKYRWAQESIWTCQSVTDQLVHFVWVFISFSIDFLLNEEITRFYELLPSWQQLKCDEENNQI